MLKPLDVLKLYPSHDYTLAGAFKSRAQRDPLRPFIVFNGRTWSWSEFGVMAEQAARLLVARGIKKGDRVGVLSRNDIGHVLLLFACARIGAIMVPTNPEFGATEVGYVLKHAGVSCVACGAELLPVVREACTGITPAPFFMLFDGKQADVPNLFELIADAPNVELPPPAAAG